ncbi:MAG TPA: glycosyltransferase family 1 protein [Kiritimatiellia bacterium]|nr:glycosyltransferase family 1 protein [Kiritimatiellia bacterium]
MRDVTTVLPTALQNLKAAARFRPVDMINWGRLVKPLRDHQQNQAGFDLLGMLFHMFTRMPFDYTPGSAADTKTPPWRIPPANRIGREPSVGLFVDAPEHLSGVATTLNNWNRNAIARSLSFRVHSAGDQPVIDGAVNFSQTGTFKLAAYEGLSLRMTDVANVLHYVQESDIDVFHLSTPGPVGLIGLLAARAKKRPVVSTFHTHFPSYVGRLTGDPVLEEVAWGYMRWFYGQMDRVAAPSTAIREELIEHGIDAGKVVVVGRGVDGMKFNPAHRDESLRASWGCDRQTRVLLYVGRLSREKNLDCLVEAYIRLRQQHRDIRLVLTGEGPHEQELKTTLQDSSVIFTGIKRGEELARHYASADVFVFPSETDTLGNVVLEAQASGLPVVVSSVGGPRDCVLDGISGIVLPQMNSESLAVTLDDMINRKAAMTAMKSAARRHSRRFTHEGAFDAFWNMHHL